MKIQVICLIVCALVATTSVFGMADIGRRNDRRSSGDWLRYLFKNKEQRCVNPVSCNSHADCCDGYDCYTVPATCTLPGPNIPGLCFYEQIHC